MYRRYNLVHLILAIVIALVLTPLMVCAAPPAQIAFVSEREGTRQIYVMEADGDNPQRLTNMPRNDIDPTWFDPAFAVAPAAKKFTIWGWLKQDVQ